MGAARVAEFGIFRFLFQKPAWQRLNVLLIKTTEYCYPDAKMMTLTHSGTVL